MSDSPVPMQTEELKKLEDALKKSGDLKSWKFKCVTPAIVPRRFPHPLPKTRKQFMAQMEEHMRGMKFESHRESRAERHAWEARWATPAALKEMQKYYDEGQKDGPLHAITRCLRYDVPIPQWAAAGFLKAVESVMNFEVNSWDALFGKPHGPGVHLAAKKKKLDKEYAVYSDVFDLHAAGRSIDESLFEEVGLKHGVGKTLAAEFYYAIKKLSDNF